MDSSYQASTPPRRRKSSDVEAPTQPHTHTHDAHGHDGPAQQGRLAVECFYGVVQSVMLVPVCISFTTIIYRDHFFSAHMPMLIKLVMFSCMVHQLCFTLRSTLPFAVGQVQDAGLIFLSAMATNMVGICRKKGYPDDEIISTVLVILSLGTFCLGLLVLMVGKFRLASLVQYLPMPVVGGYLAYIGFFCGQAGLALMANVEIAGIQDWAQLADWYHIYHIIPGVLLAVGLYTTIRIRSSDLLVLPTFLVSVLVAFYGLLVLSGHSLEDARQGGWVAERTYVAPCYQGWSYFDFSKVHWDIAPTQLVSWIGMVLVVAFSSSLDVAAIEMNIGKALNYDAELVTVGLSNTISGAMGGYTGSYIFSQTILNLRAKVESRVTGWVIICSELMIFALPFSPLAYVPKAFFGQLLLFIAIDLMMEWLVDARHKLATAEYIVNVLTFGACLYGGVETGIVCGIIFAMTAFIASYARIPNIAIDTSTVMARAHVTKGSTMKRTFEERMLLRKLSDQVITFRMRGYIFFASSVRLLNDAKSSLLHHQTTLMEQASNGSSNGSTEDASPNDSPRTPPRRGLFQRPAASESILRTPGTPRKIQVVTLDDDALHLRPLARSNSMPMSAQALKMGMVFSPVSNRGGGHVTFSDAVHHPQQEQSSPLRGGGETTPLVGVPGAGGSPSSYSATAASSGGGLDLEGLGSAEGFDEELGNGPKVQLAILDFSEATGLDASAARACFLMLRQLLRSHGIQCVFVVSSNSIRDLLVAHDVMNPAPRHVLLSGDVASDVYSPVWDTYDPCYDNLASAIEWCEEQLLRTYETHDMARHPSYYARAQAGRSRAFEGTNGKVYKAGGGGGASATAGGPTAGGVQIELTVPRGKAAPPKPPVEQQHQPSPSGSSRRILVDKADVEAQKHLESLVSILEDYLQLQESSESPFRDAALSTSLLQYFERITFETGDVIIDVGLPSGKLCLVESGLVDLVVTGPSASSKKGGKGKAKGRATARGDRSLQRISTGGMVGELGFFLGSDEMNRAKAAQRTVCWVLGRAEFDDMQAANPQLCILVQTALIKSLALTESQRLEGQSQVAML